jgi:AcrR family transcriptional regulator
MVSNNDVETKLQDAELARERHRELVAAATELFLHRGFHKTTVRDIASAAGWHLGRLYLYITAKEDVLYLINDAIMSELHQALFELAPQPTARESFRAAAYCLFSTVDRLRSRIRLIYRESASMRTEHLEAIQRKELAGREMIAGIVRRGMESGEFRPVDADLIAHDVIMLGAMWALKGWALRERLTLDAYFERQIDVLFARLLPAYQPDA